MTGGEAIRGVHHVGLSTGQLEAMVDFYTGSFGFEVVYRGGWESGSADVDEIVGLDGSAARLAMLRLGDFFVEMFEYSSPAPKPAEADRPVCDHGYTHICLEVADLDEEYRRLSDAGMRFHCAPHPAPEPVRRGSLRAVYGRDPDGNVIELLELLHPDSPLRARTGQDRQEAPTHGA